MELDIYYVNYESRGIEGRPLPPTPTGHQDKPGKAQKCGGSGCLVLMVLFIVSLICVLLVVVIILQHIFITPDRDLFKYNKDTVQVFNETISRLQDAYSDLMTEKRQLQSRINDLNDDLKNAYEKGFKWGSGWFFISNVSMTWYESRRYCRGRGADLVIINTVEKQRFITSIISTYMSVWIGLSDTYEEGRMEWVDTSPLKQGFWQYDEPNDKGNNEDCVELVSLISGLHNWNDVPCSFFLKTICEK